MRLRNEELRARWDFALDEMLATPRAFPSSEVQEPRQSVVRGVVPGTRMPRITNYTFHGTSDLLESAEIARATVFRKGECPLSSASYRYMQ